MGSKVTYGQLVGTFDGLNWTFKVSLRALEDLRGPMKDLWWHMLDLRMDLCASQEASSGWSQPKDQFEMICTSLMPNFSFLARTEAEIANWLPEGVNNDSKGGSRGWGQLWKLFKKDIYKYQVEFQLYSLNKGWDSNLTPRGQRWPPGRQGGSSGDPHNCGQLALFGVRGWVNQ